MEIYHNRLTVKISYKHQSSLIFTMLVSCAKFLLENNNTLYVVNITNKPWPLTMVKYGKFEISLNKIYNISITRYIYSNKIQ